MKIYLINYADRCYYTGQKLNSSSGLRFYNFDKVIEYGYKDLDDEYKLKNQHILSQTRGAGYWVWKPYIVKKTLEMLQDGDIVFYCDSGTEFLASPKPLIDICINETKGLYITHLEPYPTNIEALQTKKDTFVLMGLNTREYIESWPPISTTYHIWRKNEFTLNIVNEWLHYIQDERIVTDLPNTCGVEEDPRHVTHRHDQSILSLICKKYKVTPYPDPSQWGNGHRGQPPKYDQIFNHHRFRG